MLEAAALAQFREQVAREYVSREAMRELEERGGEGDRPGGRPAGPHHRAGGEGRGLSPRRVRPAHPVDPREGEAALIVRDERQLVCTIPDSCAPISGFAAHQGVGGGSPVPPTMPHSRAALAEGWVAMPKLTSGTGPSARSR